MYNNLSDFIFKISLIVFFIIAIMLFLKTNENIDGLLDLVERSYINNEVITVKESEEDYLIYKGYEVISKIISGLQYDIEIENVLVRVNDDFKDIDLSIIDDDKLYVLELEIDNTGSIIKEIYKGK
ncbi:hypothetical protein QUF55_02235 [Clostridiaceae bacterium HSG29]|nr:hypothetical protein [Clostridiaceae bacterium HSG29]